MSDTALVVLFSGWKEQLVKAWHVIQGLKGRWRWVTQSYIIKEKRVRDRNRSTDSVNKRLGWQKKRLVACDQRVIHQWNFTLQLDVRPCWSQQSWYRECSFDSEKNKPITCSFSVCLSQHTQGVLLILRHPCQNTVILPHQKCFWP